MRFDVSEEMVIPEKDRLQDLYDAVFAKSYPRVCLELRRAPQPFTAEEACRLLDLALDAGLPLRAFAVILKYCPPVPDFVSAYTFCSLWEQCYGPVEKAAWLDRADILSLLLTRGANPNRASRYRPSALEAALRGNALGSVELFMKHPALDTAWTPALLREWARPGREALLRAMAPRFTGWDPRSGLPLPIPAPMTLQIAVRGENWPLVARFCRERGPFSLKEAGDTVRLLRIRSLMHENGDRSDFAAALAALFEACPALGRRETACRVLLRCLIEFDLREEVREALYRLAEGLGRRTVVMEREEWEGWNYARLPARWKERVPGNLTLVVDRWSNIFVWPVSRSRAETIRGVLRLCEVRDPGRKGKLSPAAREALRCEDPSLVEWLLEPGRLLATEDPAALLEFVQNDSLCSPENRDAVAARLRAGDGI